MSVPNEIPKPAPARVAIILPTLGRDPRPMMRDIEAQTFTDWCGILVDQNNDPVVRLHGPPFYDLGVNHWAPDLDGYQRWIHVHAPWMRGSSNARNLGIAMALELGCEYLCCCDDDDRIDANMLQCLVDTAERHKGAMVVAQDVTYSTGNNAPRNLASISSRLLSLNALRNSSVWTDKTRPRFDDAGFAQDNRFWTQFGAPAAYCGHSHYQCLDDQEGGLRDKSGRL